MERQTPISSMLTSPTPEIRHAIDGASPMAAIEDITTTTSILLQQMRATYEHPTAESQISPKDSITALSLLRICARSINQNPRNQTAYDGLHHATETLTLSALIASRSEEKVAAGQLARKTIDVIFSPDHTVRSKLTVRTIALLHAIYGSTVTPDKGDRPSASAEYLANSADIAERLVEGLGGPLPTPTRAKLLASIVEGGFSSALLHLDAHRPEALVVRRMQEISQHIGHHTIALATDAHPELLELFPKPKRP